MLLDPLQGSGCSEEETAQTRIAARARRFDFVAESQADYMPDLRPRQGAEIPLFLRCGQFATLD
jgi:hypothetical protein